MSEPDTNLKAYQRHRFTPHQSPKVEYMPPALNTHQHHPSTPERYGCAYHEGSPTNREAQSCLVLTDPGQQHQQWVTVNFILTVLTVSVPPQASDSWRRLYIGKNTESNSHNCTTPFWTSVAIQPLCTRLRIHRIRAHARPHDALHSPSWGEPERAPH